MNAVSTVVLAFAVSLVLTVLVALCLCLRTFFPARIALREDEDEDNHSLFSFFRNSNILRPSADDHNQPDAVTLRNTNPYAIATHARSVAFERAHLQDLFSAANNGGERTRGRGLFSFPRRFAGGDRDSGQGANAATNDLTVEQKQVVEEMGVQAWEFVMDFELNCIVQDRTEVVFLEGEGGCLQTNLPLPKEKDIYYWEVKVFEKNPKTVVSVGLTTKPYPNFRYPGWNKTSVGYQSDDGRKYVSDAFAGRSYGKPYHQGDVIGIGYRPQSGTVFFTRNGMRLEDAQTGMKQALYPTVASDGPCTFHVNLGQLGFVFIEANVKKWGLAPAQGSQAPPPAYGLAEQHGDLILLEASSSSSTFPSTGAASNIPTTSAHHSIPHLHSSPLRPLSHQPDTRPFPSSIEPVPSLPHDSARSSTATLPFGTDTLRESNLSTNASTPSLNLSSFLTRPTPTPTSPMDQDDIELEREEDRRRGGVPSSGTPTRVLITTNDKCPSSASSSTNSFTLPLSSSSSPFISLNVIDAAARPSGDDRYSHVHTTVGPPPAYSTDPHSPNAPHPKVPVVSPNSRQSDGRTWSEAELEQNLSDVNIERGVER